MFALLSVIAITAAIVFIINEVVTSCKLTKRAFRALLKAAGVGYLVYHSDSQKWFYSLTYRDAVEWLSCSLDEAAIFSNWTKEALSVKLKAI